MVLNLNSNTRDRIESMSNKYVPRFMAKVSPADQTPSTTPAASAPSRWTKDEDIYRISPKKQNLINTSLPAKMAPTLAPATLSALTAQEKRAPQKSKEVALSSEDEFPTLGAKKVVKVAQVTKSFSELSKAWAVTQKEDEAKAKEEAEKEALRLQAAAAAAAAAASAAASASKAAAKRKRDAEADMEAKGDFKKVFATLHSDLQTMLTKAEVCDAGGELFVVKRDLVVPFLGVMASYVSASKLMVSGLIAAHADDGGEEE